MKTFIIDHTNENQRLDKYLKKLLPNASTSFIYKMIRKKDVKINGIRGKENTILQYGDKVSLFLYDDKFEEYRSHKRINPVDITFTVAYEDQRILVVSKTNHCDVQDNLTKQVLYYLYQKGEYDPRIHIDFTPAPVHRLDKDTTGLVIFGKDMKALQDLNKMMKDRKGIKKEYLTIVEGKVDDTTYYDSCIKDGSKMKISPNGLDMITEVKTLDYKNNYSYLLVTLITGRKHQIRLQLSHHNHPILGDSIYGIKKDYSILLHAHQITFTNPINSLTYLKNKTIQSPLPKNFKKIKLELFN